MGLILPQPGAEKGDHAPCSTCAHRKGLRVVSIPCAVLVSNPGSRSFPRKGPLEPRVERQAPQGREGNYSLLSALSFALIGRQIPEWRVTGANKEAGVSGQPWGSRMEGKGGEGGSEQGPGQAHQL